MVTFMFDDTDWVFTVKLALVWPADTVTLEGTVATDVLLLVNVTAAPPDGAAALKVTVPVDLLPPLTVVGFKVRDERVMLPEPGLMVREACAELDPRLAVITAVVVVLTDVVLTVKEVVVLPAATVTLLGTLVDELLLDSDTADPPDGAALDSVTVPCEDEPPVTLLGFKMTEDTVGPEDPPGFTVKLADTVVVPDWAKIALLQTALTLVVLTVKLTLVLPAATVTMLGKVTADRKQAGVLTFEVDSSTSLPPEGAGEAMVTVPVELLPPVTVLGFKLIEVTLIPGVTVTEPCAVLFPRVAVTVTTVLLRTNKLLAVAWKVAVVAPAGTVILLGTCGNTEALSEVSPTTEPPDGAGPLKVTVPVEVPPFEMVVGLNVSDETVTPHPPPEFGVSL